MTHWADRCIFQWPNTEQPKKAFFPALKGYFVHSTDATQTQPYDVTPFYHLTKSGALTSLPAIPRYSSSDSALKLVRITFSSPPIICMYPVLTNCLTVKIDCGGSLRLESAVQKVIHFSSDEAQPCDIARVSFCRMAQECKSSLPASPQPATTLATRSVPSRLLA